MNLHQWAIKHSVSVHALAELNNLFGLNGTETIEPKQERSEAAVQSMVRLEAVQKGMRLFRNNVGAAYMQDGSFLRYGLANDSTKLNKVLKSGDLIGIAPVRITQSMVGSIIGRFVSREIKHEGWAYSATPEEVAQLNWAQLIASFGGDAAFATGIGSL